MRRAAIAVIVLALATTAVAFAGCGGGDDLEGAKKAAEGFWKAYLDGEADAAWELITAGSKEVTSKDDFVSGASRGIDRVSLEEVTVSGSEARVRTAFALAGLDGEPEFDTVLFNEDGGWKVSLPDTEGGINEAFRKMQGEMDIPPDTGTPRETDAGP